MNSQNDDTITPLDVYRASIGRLRAELISNSNTALASELIKDIDNLFLGCTDEDSIKLSIVQITKRIHQNPDYGTRFDDLFNSVISLRLQLSRGEGGFALITGPSGSIEPGKPMICSKNPSKHGVVRYLFKGQVCDMCGANLEPLPIVKKEKPRGR